MRAFRAVNFTFVYHSYHTEAWMTALENALDPGKTSWGILGHLGASWGILSNASGLRDRRGLEKRDERSAAVANMRVALMSCRPVRTAAEPSASPNALSRCRLGRLREMECNPRGCVNDGTSLLGDGEMVALWEQEAKQGSG